LFSALKSDAESLADVFLPSLFKLCNRPNRVVLGRAEACLMQLFSFVASRKGFLRILEALAHVNKPVRVAASKCVLVVLSACILSGSVLDTNSACAAASVPTDSHCHAPSASLNSEIGVDLLMAALSRGLEDPALEVRDIHRTAFLQFKEKFPAEAEQ
jgi:hypothetical protein